MTNETKHTPGKMWQVYERYPKSYAIVMCPVCPHNEYKNWDEDEEGDRNEEEDDE